jgi:hypothetical protein
MVPFVQTGQEYGYGGPQLAFGGGTPYAHGAINFGNYALQNPKPMPVSLSRICREERFEDLLRKHVS